MTRSGGHTIAAAPTDKGVAAGIDATQPRRQVPMKYFRRARSRRHARPRPRWAKGPPGARSAEFRGRDIPWPRHSVAYGWYFSSTVSAAPDLGFMVTRTVTLLVFAAFSNCSTVHLEVP